MAWIDLFHADEGPGVGGRDGSDDHRGRSPPLWPGRLHRGGRSTAGVWAVAEARHAVQGHGAPLSLGTFVNVAVHPDAAVARDLVRGSAALFAHFVSEGPHDVVPDDDRAVVERVRAAYDEAAHGLTTAGQATLLPDALLDRFAVVGSPEHCTTRLRELIDLGLDRIIVVPGSRDADPDVLAASNEPFAAEVLPRLRTATGAG
ncbi:LLM class flavin-dependent oxidoreductase [Geodermatophilus amargosae]|uniref:LLM class flavin-dependent oxidoreductase n=1 Tax=Geodermatophilus amargosae TaxID=1296565 RepID=UPI0034DF39E5